MSRECSTWTVYDHPVDMPNYFVARRFEYDHPEPLATDDVIVADDLDELRNELSLMGLIPMCRNESDEPQIVETWI